MNRYPSNRPIVRTILSAAALLIAASVGAAAQDGYPSRTIKIIVPFQAGRTLDVLTRVVGERLAAKWGQPVVIENRVGAVGNIGTEAVARRARRLYAAGLAASRARHQPAPGRQAQL
jgi:tripartite-type tricarboxylate transporter receptor subunit TctC